MSDRPVFLVSTGRTGTRSFARLFAEHGRDVTAHHTTSLTRPLNMLNNLAYLRLLPQGLADAWLKYVKAPSIRATPGRYVECNPYYFGNIPALRRLFPGTRFVFVTRHPRAFVVSHIRWERQRIASRIANQLLPFWGPVGYHEQLLGLRGDTGQRVRYYAKVWNRRNRVIAAATDGDRRARSLRFEDVFGAADGLERLRELFAWLDIPLQRELGPGALAHRLNRSAPELLADWEDRYDMVLQRECGAAMARFGYEI